MTAIIDCCDRTIVGWRISRSGKAKIAAAALEDALIRRNPGPGLILRSDNGLVFGSDAFSSVARASALLQEFITPYTPEQNGMIERWFLTLKSECIWMQNFETFDEARKKSMRLSKATTQHAPLSRSAWCRRLNGGRNMQLSGLQTGDPHYFKGLVQVEKKRSMTGTAEERSITLANIGQINEISAAAYPIDAGMMVVFLRIANGKEAVTA